MFRGGLRGNTIRHEYCALPVIWSDRVAFARFLTFIGIPEDGRSVVLAEVESLEKFSEVWQIPLRREDLDALWSQSRLPHFSTVCFDKSGSWGVLYSNLNDRVAVWAEGVVDSTLRN